MKTKTMLAAAVLTGLLLLSGCEWFLGERLTDSERAAAFIETANESRRDYDAMREHFHPEAPSYSSMNTPGFWEETFFAADEQLFATRGLQAGDALSGFPGTSSLSGSITSRTFPEDGVAIRFGFLPDPASPLNRLIYVIIVEEDLDIIRSIH